MRFLENSVQVSAIRKEDIYGGKRVILQSRLGPARLRVQVDVGTGDAVTPEPEWLDYPSLLSLPCARLRAYQPETTIAEKLHAMVTLGSKNSRMRDFFDVDALAARMSFDGQRLSQSVLATFERRQTPLPHGLPLALTPAFSEVQDKGAQWIGFLKKSGLRDRQVDLEQVIGRIAAFLWPVIAAAGRRAEFTATWSPGGPWQSQDRPKS